MSTVTVADYLELPESSYPMPPLNTCVCFHYCSDDVAAEPIITRRPWSHILVQLPESASSGLPPATGSPRQYQLLAITVWELDSDGNPGRLLDATALATHVVSTTPYRVEADSRLRLHELSWLQHQYRQYELVAGVESGAIAIEFVPTEDVPMWNVADDSIARTQQLTYWRMDDRVI